MPLPAPDRAYFERRLGRDLGAVRLHDGPRSRTLAGRLGAVAFTLGPDIAFAPGRRAPGATTERGILAHELAHVVQQAGGAPAVGLEAAPLALQPLLETLGGTWDVTRYELTSEPDGAAHAGCSITLALVPGPQVDAERIGFVQRVTTVRNGNPFYNPLRAESRSVPEEGGGRSWIDRPPAHHTPIYGMENPPSAQPTLGASEPMAEIAWGCRYTDEAGVPHEKPARLDDTARLSGHGPESRQTFETAALAVEGRQAGTYYGSIRWGWRSDAENVPRLEPVEVASVGTPSETFVAAAAAWNAQPPSFGRHNLPLPLPAGGAHERLPQEMSLAEVRARLREIEAERAAARSENPLVRWWHGSARDTTTLDFEEHALRRELDSRLGDRPPGDLIPPPTTPITGG